MPAASSTELSAAVLRREALSQYAILDTPPEERFDRITRLAAHLLRAPIALVTFADTNRVWFKACMGLSDRELPYELAFCPHALGLSQTLIIEDAAADPRFAENPLVTGEPHIRFYAGAQLRTGEGVVLGTLCVLGHEPRAVSPEDVKALEDLSTGVIAELELRRLTAQLERELGVQQRLSRELDQSRTRLQDFLDATADMLWETDADLRVVAGGGGDIAGVTFSDIRGRTLSEATRAFPMGGVPESFADALAARRGFRALELGGALSGGRPVWLELSGHPVFADGVFQGYRGVTRDITERKLAEEQVRRLAEEDPLTGLPNRRRFEAGLRDALADEGAPGALLLLDIDYFKSVNDSFGHDIGDLLVCGVADRILGVIRSGDLAARIGGDEFAVVLRDADATRLTGIAERIVAAMAEPFRFGDTEIAASLSVGGARMPQDGDDLLAILKSADLALYEAKHQGRARYSLSSQMH